MHVRILSNEQRASSSYSAITKVSFACIITGLINTLYMNSLGTAVAQWLRYCATNRKVAGSIPDGVIGIFH
jgi:hypothetical protein